MGARWHRYARAMGEPVHHASHWGAYRVEVADGGVSGVTPHPDDRDPAPLLANIAGTVAAPCRVRVPTVRRGWWEDGPGPDDRRGADAWLEVGWDEVLDRLAGELRRVRDDHGANSIYAGSYGWASAGRFHHAQSQLRRFVNLLGGATVSVGTYSTGAAERLLPHVVGDAEEVWRGATAWSVIAAHTDLLVAFGGVPAKNAFVSPGGVVDHTVAGSLRAGVGRGMRIESFSPILDDVAGGLGAAWHALRPGTDVAVMLGLAHVLLTEGLADLAWADRYCHGADRLIDYVLGAADGTAKTPEWAESISEVPAAALQDLARRMAVGRTMITSSWSLQRARYGEQPLWMSIALACLLGQIGLPGGGFGHGYGSLADIGADRLQVPIPALPGAIRRLDSWIPVARVADMLLDPGGVYEVDGQHRQYPDIRLVYWTGGNPFHHHQDLNRLRRAWRRPDTVVVHEPYWTATARHADVVLPATITLERNDIAAGRGDGRLVAMQQAVAPFGLARSDYEIFSGLAARLGFEAELTEGRDERAWLELLYGRLARRLTAAGVDAPPWADFWSAGELALPAGDGNRVLYAALRADPDAHPLGTPSGRIELWSDAIEGFGYDDCPPQPRWLEPEEWLGGEAARHWPLHLIANNPATRLHSQLDPGAASLASKIAGREPIRMHPDDAAARGLHAGEVVRVWNDRGACLAGVIVTDAVRAGVVQLSTGAWYDPDDPTAAQPLCVHGNPNVLTRDIGTSRLAQACTGQHALVEVARHDGPLPPVRAWDPPAATPAPGPDGPVPTP
jgi:biotin/methionine sulfoxide reductase